LYITSLYLKDFRNYRDQHIKFSEESNIILGNNGQGKTNLIEAIFVLSTSKSFRHVSDRKMVRWGTEGYIVRGSFITERGEYDVSLECKDQKKNFFINGVPEYKVSSIIGYIYCVLFSFEDIFLITGSPQVRRNFLNLVLSTVDPLYFHNLKLYIQLIKQKNRYLKDSGIIDKKLLGVWNDQLAQAGSYIVQKRIAFIDFINLYIVEHGGQLTHFRAPRMFYKSNIRGVGNTSTLSDIEDAFREELLKRMNMEIGASQSVTGPHRDDFVFFENNYEIRYFGSIGEARLSSIMLKMAQGAFYSKSKAVIPLMLIDDILLELDSRNREKVLSLFRNKNQMIVTATERVRLPEIFSFRRVFHISNDGDIIWDRTEAPSP